MSAGAQQKPETAPVETAVICVTRFISGRSHTSTTVVFSDGGGAIVDGQGHGLGNGPLRSHRLFNQLKTSMPLVGLPMRPLKRTNSVGTAIHVIFRGEETPDLMRAGNDQAKAIRADVEAVLAGIN